ncbi:MAG: ADP-glyceromanno-heptose 6-epimerase [Bacteroidetes bacterium]|nr:ADP-glyceromanno-heptose 6-epimerase [Bacteroidota bacterium]
MIVITGAAGFIASCVVAKFNAEGHTDIVLVDDFSKLEKEANYRLKTYYQKIERKHFFNWFEVHFNLIEYVIHLGARTDTTEFNKFIFDELNLNFSKKMWEMCATHNIPLIYASSAATYGMGEFGYSDNHANIENLKPLNPYGDSKNDFDKWAIKTETQPPHWYGLKFFNVYGPNEYHKGRMASVVFHSYNQIKLASKVKLFKSHNPNYTNGGQLRDFVYVKDVANVIWFLFSNKCESGIYNLGSGKARSFYDLAKATFNALNVPVNIEYIDTPVDIRDKYQYFTEADMTKLKQQGYLTPFTQLEDGVKDYVCEYLNKNDYL